MRVEYLDYFVAVVEYGAISKAANELFISPQGLSQAIQKLEQELEVMLFYREGSRLTLTAAGETAYEMAKSIGTMAQDMQSAMAPFRAKSRSAQMEELCILSAPVVNTTFLPKVMIQMRKRYPALHMSVYEVDSERMFERFEEMPGSILILSLPEPEHERMLKDSPRALNYYELYRTPIMACVSSKSPLSGRSSVPISEFHKHSLIIYGVEDRLLRLLDVEAEPDRVMLNTSSLPMCRSVLSGEKDGISFTNEIVERYIKTPSLTAIPLVPSIDMLIGYFIQPEQRADPIVREFTNLLKEEIQSS